MSQDSSATPLPGSLDPDPRLVASALSEAGISAETGQLKLLPVFSGSGRRELAVRRHFRVVGNDRILCHLVTGTGLHDLRQRSTGFAEACPEIACRPIFFRSSADADYLGFEYFDGQDLETLVRSGELTASEAIDLAERVLTVLDRTRQLSTITAAIAELEATLGWIAQSPLFGGLDQIILTHAIFPFVRTAMTQTSPSTRWTNGDFVARNILVDQRREVRLIDYEFAAKTHFYSEDGWRWHMFSKLPEEARHLQCLHGELRSNPSLEAYAILRQMASAQEVNGAQAAIDDSRRDARRLIELLRNNTSLLRTSVFFRSWEEAHQQSNHHSRKVVAQLYWSKDGSYCEFNSQRIPYECDTDERLCFSISDPPEPLFLRFDPADCVGSIELKSFTIVANQQSFVVVDSDASSQKSTPMTVENLVFQGTPFGCNLVSINDDPQLILNDPIQSVGNSPLTVEIRLKFEPCLTKLKQAFSRPIAR